MAFMKNMYQQTKNAPKAQDGAKPNWAQGVMNAGRAFAGQEMNQAVPAKAVNKAKTPVPQEPVAPPAGAPVAPPAPPAAQPPMPPAPAPTPVGQPIGKPMPAKGGPAKPNVTK